MPKRIARRTNNANQVAATKQATGNFSSLSVDDSVSSTSDVRSSLEKEFCPPLDESLVAALLSDHEELGPSGLATIRDTLRQLAAGAEISFDREDLCGYEDKAHVDSSSQSQSSFINSENVAGSSASSDVGSFSSPLGFLRTLFPQASVAQLQGAINSCTLPIGTNQSLNHLQTEVFSTEEEQTIVDMDAIVNQLLSEEYIREIIERGYVPGEQEVKGDDDSERSWQTAHRRRSEKVADPTSSPSFTGLPLAKPKRTKALPTPLVDLRQRQHAPNPLKASGTSSPDPWVYFASLATLLAKLLPQTSYTGFLALFHNPTYPNPISALRAHLKMLMSRPSTVQGGTKNNAIPSSRSVHVSRHDVESLASFIPSQNSSGSISDEVISMDAELCLSVTSGHLEDAYDLLLLLRDMDAQYDVVVHSAPLPVGLKAQVSGLYPAPPDVSYKPSLFPATPPASPSPSASKPKSPIGPPNAWATVERRKGPSTTAATGLAAYIPAYRQKGGNTPIRGSAFEWRAKADEIRVKRDAALRQASSHWQRGKHGGEVAMFYAEEARRLDAERRDWAVQGARAQMSEASGNSSAGVIDLHGLTVHESQIVVKEAVTDWWSVRQADSSKPRTFTVITGVGRHSSGPGVLGPSVLRILESEGWRVQKEFGKLVITGSRY